MIFQKRSCFERGVYRSIESFLAYFLRVTLASRNLVAKLLYSSDMPKCSSYRSVLSSYEHLTCCFVWSASPGCECARFLTFQPFVVCRPGNVKFLKATTTASLNLTWLSGRIASFLCMRPVSAMFPTHGQHPKPASLITSSANFFARVLSYWHAVNGILWPRQ